MPRRVMRETAGVVFHVLNRGVRRMRLFNEAGDYEAFLRLVGKAQERVPMRCLAYCLMPNHFHLVLWPPADGALSRFMFWLQTTHSVRWNAWHGQTGIGHVYQGRFKAFPIYQDAHFLRVCRYVECNALRADLVSRARDWPWSSLAQRAGANRAVVLADWPVPRPPDWEAWLKTEIGSETKAIRHSIVHSAPFGPNEWRRRIAAQFGLDSSLRGEGRPKNKTTQPDF
jgi:putative transposase